MARLPLQVTGAILAGGSGRRMGGDKAEYQVALPSGERLTLIQLVHRALAEACSEVIVVGGPPRKGVPARLVPDLMQEAGILGGICSALRSAANELVFVAGCDMPFVLPAAVAGLVELAEGHDIVVPRLHGEYEPLHAVYRTSCAGPAGRILGKGPARVTALFPLLDVREVTDEEYARLDPTGLSLANLNTPQEYRDALERIATGRFPT